jgi:hypothetical protein
MRKHLKDWGAVYIILALFLGSWVGQALAMRDDGPEKFWAATFENWQSEFLQLAFQAVVLLGLRHVLFKADAEDEERLEGKLDQIIRLLDPPHKDRTDGA